MNWVILAGLPVGAFILGYFCYFFYLLYKRRQAKRQAQEIISDARASSQESHEEIQQKKEELSKYRTSLEKKVSRLESRNKKLSDRIDFLKEQFDNRQTIVRKLESETEELMDKVNEKKSSLRELDQKRINRLEDKTSTSSQTLLKKLQEEIISRAELTAHNTKSNRTESVEGQKRQCSRRIVNRTINRCDVTTPVEVPSAVLKFPDEEAYVLFKEFYDENEEPLVEAIDSEVRFEDEQAMAVVETLEPLQKEVAHRTLNNLIQQKKFSFDMITEGVKRYTRQVQGERERAAREAISNARIGDVPEELVNYLGILKFRTSYGQQQLNHSLEVSHLGGLMAQEIGANAKLTRRAGLLHDVGKAIDRQRDQGHAPIGAELTEESGEPDAVVNAVGSHHGDMEAKYVISILVAAADAISGSRPGARRENATNYTERIKALRTLAGRRTGILKVHAMDAGRELRIQVDRNVVNDQEMKPLAKSIAQDIEDELTYSGKIKVNTIRETKITRIIHTD